jgi:hypothetical protein
LYDKFIKPMDLFIRQLRKSFISAISVVLCTFGALSCLIYIFD